MREIENLGLFVGFVFDVFFLPAKAELANFNGRDRLAIFRGCNERVQTAAAKAAEAFALLLVLWFFFLLFFDLEDFILQAAFDGAFVRPARLHVIFVEAKFGLGDLGILCDGQSDWIAVFLLGAEFAF